MLKRQIKEKAIMKNFIYFIKKNFGLYSIFERPVIASKFIYNKI